MSRFLQFGAAALSLVAISSAANAQSPGACCGGCSGVQSYQRYSYQPVPSQQPMPAAVGPTYSAAPLQSQAAVVPSQSYRRYSYQPAPTSNYYYSGRAYSSGRQYSSGRKKAPWEYAKGEPERNRP